MCACAGGEAAGPSTRVLGISVDNGELGEHESEDEQVVLVRFEEKLEAKQKEMEAELSALEAKQNENWQQLLELLEQ
eukprot:5125418-Alexandrium_andersonii.AAC.1